MYSKYRGFFLFLHEMYFLGSFNYFVIFNFGMRKFLDRVTVYLS